MEYDPEKDFLVVQNQTVATGEVFVPSGSRLDGSWSSTTPRGSIEFEPTEDLLLYASVSKGFKSGGINSFIFSPADLRPYDPEEPTAYEIGMKSDWFDQRLRINLALFTSDYSGLQLRAVLEQGHSMKITQIASSLSTLEITQSRIWIIARPRLSFSTTMAKWTDSSML